jgi:large subunit ribosomal protein L23
MWQNPSMAFDRWEKETFYESKKEQQKFEDSQAPEAATKAPEAKRELLAEQAKLMLGGKETWKPTWQALGLNFDRPLLGRGTPPAEK